MKNNKSITKTKYAIAMSIMIASPAMAQSYTYSYGDALKPGGITLANGTVMTGQTFGGGAGSEHGRTGFTPQNANIGGSYQGNVFAHPNASAVSSVNLITQIQGSPKGAIDQGRQLEHKKFVGFYIAFSQPTMLKDFYGLDIDGRSINGNRAEGNHEWFSSFAYNGDTLINPTMILSSSSNLAIENNRISNNNHTQWQQLVNNIQGVSATRNNLPGRMNMAVSQNDSQKNGNDNRLVNDDPDTARTQVLVDYEQTVTDLYIMWGMEGNSDFNGGEQNSGITGFSLDAAPVPEPSSTALIGLGGLALIFRRRK